MKYIFHKQYLKGDNKLITDYKLLNAIWRHLKSIEIITYNFDTILKLTENVTRVNTVNVFIESVYSKRIVSYV